MKFLVIKDKIKVPILLILAVRNQALHQLAFRDAAQRPCHHPASSTHSQVWHISTITMSCVFSLYNMCALKGGVLYHSLSVSQSVCQSVCLCVSVALSHVSSSRWLFDPPNCHYISFMRSVVWCGLSFGFLGSDLTAVEWQHNLIGQLSVHFDFSYSL